MKYMLLIYFNASEAPKVTPEQQKAAFQSWQNYEAEAKAAGVLVFRDGFAPASSATTVRIRNGKTLISDGPFAETHEQLGGFFLLDCKDLDEAIAWATKLPGVEYGSIEVRPMWNGQ